MLGSEYLKTSCSTRVNNVDRELLIQMKRSGCHMISYGIESGSQKMLNVIRKRITLRQAKNAMRLSRKIGIDTCATFVLGVPSETWKTFWGTINFAKK